MQLKALTFVLLLALIPAVRGAEPPTKKKPHWTIQLAIAQQSEGEEIILPKEIELARPALEKFSKQSKFRKYSLVKNEGLPFSATESTRIDFDKNLRFSFQIQVKGEKKFLEAAWLKKGPGDKDPYKQVGGKVQKPFQLKRSLVLLGPKTAEGVAMAVLRLEGEP
jgi:hypothetical protein